jgi:hypothetical protein
MRFTRANLARKAVYRPCMIAGECDGRVAISAVVVAVAAATITMLGAVPPSPAAPRLQVGVLGDGYVAAEQTASGWRVVELTDDGTPRVEHALAADDARIVGSSIGPVAGLLAGHQVELVRASDGRRLGAWGTHARRLCDGAASNASRFGVAWLEDDGRVWVVHGKLASAAGDDVPPSVGPTTWCGVASAGRNLVLMWRDSKRMYFNTCTPKSCRGSVPFLSLDDRVALLGVGCVETACLIATRAPGAGAQLQLITAAGGIKWRTPLDTAAAEVSIVGAGNDAFAVGYPGAVIGIDRKAVVTQLWRGDGTTAVAWARGRVLVAADAAGTLATSTVAYP